MRPRIVRWGSLAYVVFSLVALIWLSISNASARTFRETTLASQAALLGNTLLGATQNLDAVSAPGGSISGEDAARFLVNAEASLAQVEIVALGYEQISGIRLPLGSLVGVYTAQIRLVREELGRGNTLTPENYKALADVKSDLELLRTACQGGVLTHGNQENIAALFENTAAALSVSAAKSSLQQSESK